MITDEQKARLTPEQLTVAEWWEEKRKQREKIYDKFDVYGINHRDLAKELRDIDGDYCPHERYIMSSCMACDEVERLLHPEHYCNECKQYGEPEEKGYNRLIDGVCESCRDEE